MGMIMFSEGDTVFIKTNTPIRGYVISTNPDGMNDFAEPDSYMLKLSIKTIFSNVAILYQHDVSSWRTVLLEKIVFNQ